MTSYALLSSPHIAMLVNKLLSHLKIQAAEWWRLWCNRRFSILKQIQKGFLFRAQREANHCSDCRKETPLLPSLHLFSAFDFYLFQLWKEGDPIIEIFMMILERKNKTVAGERAWTMVLSTTQALVPELHVQTHEKSQNDNHRVTEWLRLAGTSSRNTKSRMSRTMHIIIYHTVHT